MIDGPHAREIAHAAAVRALAASDARLAAVIERVGPCKLGASTPGSSSAHGHFTGLVEAIVNQQLSPKAADTIFARVRALTGGPFDPASVLAVAEERLRGAGLSGAKARYIRGICEAALAGSLRLDELDAMDDDAVIDHLCELKGIGRWTAEMLLMFRLGRLDVLPTDDLGVQKGFQRLFRMRALPSKPRMIQLARPWRPYRSIACWYLWRLNDEPPSRAGRVDKPR
jgi:DNA-3-methyladenine glycosylase II